MLVNRVGSFPRSMLSLLIPRKKVNLTPGNHAFLPGWALACPGSDQINQRPVYGTRSEARARRLIEEPGRSCVQFNSAGWLLGSGTAVSRFPCSRQLVLDRSDRAFIIWKRGEGEGRSRARRTSRAVQERGDIASKQQGSPFRTDYNKLATLIETNGKLSALFARNAIPIKVGERFCNLRLVTLFD
ncbi:hypothetical protein SLEP1_g59417 [Rubroshorea leprosula]|uniref:Uncharacterized protein n=1 Tax=Rubroshorea leprosula TaxID=152421 RepID=A0AAV5MVV6_9ROSI|nr:hypothetical protein SLEP1_g59388 [Rubroshorea leprosula]GKV52861.1 hypothetical protein SLEP1_g59417 [Rubroshorea leprosula]